MTIKVTFGVTLGWDVRIVANAFSARSCSKYISAAELRYAEPTASLYGSILSYKPANSIRDKLGHHSLAERHGLEPQSFSV